MKLNVKKGLFIDGEPLFMVLLVFCLYFIPGKSFANTENTNSPDHLTLEDKFTFDAYVSALPEYKYSGNTEPGNFIKDIIQYKSDRQKLYIQNANTSHFINHINETQSMIKPLCFIGFYYFSCSSPDGELPSFS